MSEEDPFARTLAAADSDGLAATVASTQSDHARSHEPMPVGADRFVASDELGRGGMGVVFSAVDRQFNREVALKRLRDGMLDPSSVDRFATECLITGNLSHPGIPAVYERGEVDGTPFYAMQRVQGRTVDEVLRTAETLEQRLTLVPALSRVAQTLAYAHSHGVIHRDIKPSNIVIGAYGETFVLDWGIAKVRGLAADSAVTSAAAEHGNHSTRVGQVVGTPAYMSPEQADGRVNAIDERTDVFALGALLYHILTGHPPYEGGSADDAIARARRGDVVSIHRAARTAPKALRTICERAMALQPADRFRSAADVATALERFTSEAVAHQDTGPVGWIARAITIATGLLALVAAGAVVQAVPTFREAGHGAIAMAVVAAIGLGLSALEYATRGAYRLNPFILALAASTLVAGLLTTTDGLNLVYRAALANTQDLEKLRFILIEGTREAIGALTIGCLLTISQLLAWAIARRQASRA